MNDPTQTAIFDTVTCPACGLLCDDLVVARAADGNLTVREHGCQKSVAFFSRPPRTPSPRVDGKPAALEIAVARAAQILKAARQPLVAGLASEVQGMRAVLALADKCGATVDHMNSNAFMRNIQVVQNSGWLTTTLTEVRNRVDLLVIVGTDVVGAFPRFFERVVWNKESMFGQDTASREIVYLGGRNIDTHAGIAPDGRQPDVLPCDLARLPEVVAALRALVLGKPLRAAEVGGIATADLARLAERLRAAKYSVVAWSSAALDFPHAELTVQNIAQLVMTLNETTRSSGLPLGGNDGEMNANQVSAWISGYPMRTSYARGYPEYDPYHLSAERLLAEGEADALLWVSNLNPERPPPQTSLPTVVFGHPDMRLAQEPAVFIPVGVPGVDHSGIAFRCDSVVSLPLARLRDSALPPLPAVLTAIEQAL